MILSVISFLVLFMIVFLSINSVEKNPSLRIYWMLIGAVLFFMGAICLVVNSVGLTLGMLEWIEAMDPFAAFMFKIALIMSGVIIFVLVNHNPEAYDEYFDGKKYKED